LACAINSFSLSSTFALPFSSNSSYATRLRAGVARPQCLSGTLHLFTTSMVPIVVEPPE
jgi:hypothetical protein